jgi:catechol 2,3-dioxygenase-like lactoylglutathione lyase family enzyme
MDNGLPDEARLVALVGVSDIERADAFYGGALGLRLLESSSFANLYEAHGGRLRVTRVDEPVRAPYTVLGWEVSDMVAALDDLARSGLEPQRFDGVEQDARGVWTAPGGTRVAWFHDPDGNVVSLSQRP